jgi:uncharacterized protein YhfF
MDALAEFWSRCRAVLPDEPLGGRYTVRRIGNGEAICEMLLGLIATGQKTGVFSLPSDLEAEGVVPHTGDYVILVDFSGRPRCLVKMEECRQMKFGEVGPQQTACESPAARDVEVWRGIHRQYWGPVLAARNMTLTDDLPILFQRFRLLHAVDR